MTHVRLMNSRDQWYIVHFDGLDLHKPVMVMKVDFPQVDLLVRPPISMDTLPYDFIDMDRIDDIIVLNPRW